MLLSIPTPMGRLTNPARSARVVLAGVKMDCVPLTVTSRQPTAHALWTHFVAGMGPSTKRHVNATASKTGLAIIVTVSDKH